MRKADCYPSPWLSFTMAIAPNGGKAKNWPDQRSNTCLCSKKSLQTRHFEEDDDDLMSLILLMWKVLRTQLLPQEAHPRRNRIQDHPFAHDWHDISRPCQHEVMSRERRYSMRTCDMNGCGGSNSNHPNSMCVFLER